jgi:hypothetical protein
MSSSRLYSMKKNAAQTIMCASKHRSLTISYPSISHVPSTVIYTADLAPGHVLIKRTCSRASCIATCSPSGIPPQPLTNNNTRPRHSPGPGMPDDHGPATYFHLIPCLPSSLYSVIGRRDILMF